MPVAYLPQHSWQVSGTFFGCVVIAWMSYVLVRGEVPGADLGRGAARLIASGGLLIGAGVVVAAWTVNAEPPCGSCNGDHWGGTFGVVALIIEMAFGVAVTVNTVRNERRRLRSSRRRDPGAGQPH